MSKGWRVRPLGDVATIVNGGTPKTGVDEYWGGSHCWVTPAEMGNLSSPYLSMTKRTLTDAGINNSSAKLVPKRSVIMSIRAPIGHLVINEEPMATNQGCRSIVPKSNLHYKYLYYYLLFNTKRLDSLGTGATFRELSAAKLKGFSIPIPSIAEQKRIVAILDDAFERIDTAIANTDKNLANARELFESYLERIIFEKKPLGEFVEIKTGKLNANAAKNDGVYPFFTCAREVYKINSYAFDCEAILLAGNNASGDFNVKHYKGKFNAYQRTYVINIKDTEKLRYRFLYFQMINSLKLLKKSSVGTGTKFLKIGMIKNLPICLPSVVEQDFYVEKLDDLQDSVDKLENQNNYKLNYLNDLKQSLLQKAFSGELTADLNLSTLEP